MATSTSIFLFLAVILTFFPTNIFTNIAVNRSTTYYKVPFAIDAYGVERSFEPFYSQPKLFLNVTYDMYEVDPKIPPTERAEIMLADDMLHNSKLKVTWEIAMSTNPTYNSEQFAAYAYSMSEPEYLYIAFNDETSAFRDDSNYLTYYYKGFYGLLLLSCQDYDFELYRGVNYTVPAEVNQYLRFNRFLSSSKNFGIAQKYANSSTGQGTIFVIQGTKHANHIAPYSIVPEDEEYLISQDAQFFVTDVRTINFPDSYKATQITMSSVAYKKINKNQKPKTKKTNKKQKQKTKTRTKNNNL